MNPIIRWILKRLDSDKDVFIAITGDRGSGKSYGSLTIAEEVLKEKNMNVTQNLFMHYEAWEWLDALTQKTRKYQIDIIDEGGIFAGNRDWNSKSNKIVSKISQMVRYLNRVVIFNLPSLDKLDSHIRSLIHLHIETDWIDKSRNLLYVKARLIKRNQLTGDEHYVKLKGTLNNQKTVGWNLIALKKPKLEEWYTQESKFQKNKQIKEFANQLQQLKI